jgi:hypothetical protein
VGGESEGAMATGLLLALVISLGSGSKVPGVLVPNLLPTVPMMRWCRGALTVERVIRAWLSNAMAVTHYRRIVDARGS